MSSAPKVFGRLAALFCLLLFPLFLKAASDLSLSGTVTDATGSVIRNATVSLYSSTALLHRTETAADGSFAFLHLAPGTYVVECFREGFQKRSLRIVLNDRSETLPLVLSVAGLHQQVLVIASQLPELPGEISKAVSVVSAEELADRDVVSLNDALRQIPSLQIQQLGGPGTLARYRFRGLRPEDSAILLDGFRFHDPSDIKGSASPLLSDLVTTTAERIEVLEGAGSALYGSNSIGGTIQVVSRQPTRPLSGAASWEGGSLGLLRGSAELGGQTLNQRLSYLVHSDHVNYTRGMDDQDTYRLNSEKAQGAYKLRSGARLFLRFEWGDSFLFLNESPSPLPDLPPALTVRSAIPFPNRGATFYPQFDDPDNHQRNRFFSGAARFDHQFNRHWAYAAGLQALRTRRRFDDGPAVSPLAQQLGFEEGPTTIRQSYEGANEEAFWRNTIQIGSANVAHVGFEFHREALDQNAFGLTTAAAQRSYALALANQTRLREGRFHLQVAFQGQWYGLDNPRFSDTAGNPFTSIGNFDIPAAYTGDVSLAYFIAASNTKIRFHAGNGYRAPSLFERFGSGGSGAFRFYFGNPQLRPERSTFLDGGFDQFLLRDRLQVSGTYFYTHLQTIVDFGSTPGDPFGRSFGYINLRGGNARGVEISFHSRPASLLSFSASYTFTNSEQPSPTLAGTTRVLGVSNHQFTAAANLKPQRRITLNLLATGMSDYDFPLFGLVFRIPSQVYRFPGYLRMDLTATYLLHQGEKSKVRLQMCVDNLLDREYYQAGFRAPKATIRSGIHFDF